MAKALRDIRSHPHPRCCLAVPRALNAFFSPFLREERSPSRQKRPVRNQPHGSPRATYPPGRPSYGNPLELRGRGGSIRSPGAPRALNPLTMWLGEGNYAWGEEIAAVGTMIVRLARTCSSSLGGESTLSVCVCGADAEHAVSEIPRWHRRLLQLGDTLKEILWW